MYIHECLPGVGYILSLIYTYMFPGGELWATNDPARDRYGVCKTTTQTDIKGLYCLRFDMDYIKVFGFPSDHP